MGDPADIAPPVAPAAAASLEASLACLRGWLGPGDESVETHFAWVFLVGDRAWKLRKPVRRDTMDYRTLAARRQASEEDVRLNRRLAPHVYLGTRTLTRAADGYITLGGGGEVIEWLVEMRRLDRTRMLDARLAQGAPSTADLARVAALLARFYRDAPPAALDGAALETRLRAQLARNEAVLQSIAPDLAAGTRAAQSRFLAQHRDWLHARAAGGCVVEAHGDLRPEHVFVGEPPAVIDCLEFDRELRILDRAEELAFLELECTRLGHPQAGRRLRAACLGLLEDRIEERLLDFYRSHRAATRARLCAWRADEPDGGSPAHWRARAGSYLARARDHAQRAVDG
jgi:aminoglycoside phosphotransferase family enzyme